MLQNFMMAANIAAAEQRAEAQIDKNIKQNIAGPLDIPDSLMDLQDLTNGLWRLAHDRVEPAKVRTVAKKEYNRMAAEYNKRRGANMLKLIR